MKIFILGIIVLSLLSCKEKSVCPIESIIVEGVQENPFSFIEKIEVVPLETRNDCLLDYVKKVCYYPEDDFYLLFDSRQIVYLFDDKGLLMSYSTAAYGEGPEQYFLAIDAIYNPFSKTIDLLDPTKQGEIISYDLDFRKKVKTLKLGIKKEEVIDKFIALSSSSYAIAHPVLKDEAPVISFYRFLPSGEKIVKNRICSGYVTGVSMMQTPFIKTESKFYVSPVCLDYQIYEIREEEQSLAPCLKLDFGSDNICKKALDEQFGSDALDAKCAYLMSSGDKVPLTRLASDSFIYTHIVINRVPAHFIYNRIEKHGKLIGKQGEFTLPPCREIHDNILYALIEVENLTKYLSEDLMSEEDIAKVKDLKEDDNPVIVKYYLKR